MVKDNPYQMWPCLKLMINNDYYLYDIIKREKRERENILKWSNVSYHKKCLYFSSFLLLECRIVSSEYSSKHILGYLWKLLLWNMWSKMDICIYFEFHLNLAWNEILISRFWLHRWYMLKQFFAGFISLLHE